MPNIIGQSLGRYHILEQLGEGGMATVYKAYDTRLERDVAVKVIRVDQFAPAVLERILKRFEREAKSLAKLSHPNIVPVIDYGEHEGVPYLVMVYLPGGSLKGRLGQPMPWLEASRMLLPIARGLAYAHQRGVLHRDVKPSNILIGDSGEPMLTDFGIAKILESEDTQTLTGTGIGVGTPEYMAPEQWTGQATPQSDIYSLGVVFFELITGRKPYTADTPAAILLKQATEPLPRPAQFVAGLPEGVEKILFKALARKPEDRYADMAAFAGALEHLLTGSPIPVPDSLPKRAVSDGGQGKEETPKIEQSAAPRHLAEDSRETIEQEATRDDLALATTETPLKTRDQPSTPAAKPGGQIDKLSTTRPNWKRWILVAVLMAILGIGLVVGGDLLKMGRQKQSPLAGLAMDKQTPPLTFTPTTIFTPTHTPAFTPTRTQTLTPTAYGGGSGKIAFESNRNGNQEIYVMNADGSDPLNLTNNGVDIYWTARSPDGSKILFCDRNWEIWVMKADGSNSLDLNNKSADDSYPAWSPDGSKITFVSSRDGNREIYVINADGSNQQRLTNNAAYDMDPAWSPDGNKIAFTSTRDGDFEIYVMNADGSNQRNLTNNGQNPAWSPDGSKIAFISSRDGNWEIYVTDADGSNQRNLTDNVHSDENPVWSPDGSKIAFISDRDGDFEIYVMNADGSDQRNISNNTAANYSPAWSPDGRMIAFESNRDGNWEIYVTNADGSDPLNLTNNTANGVDPVWLP